MTLFSSRSKGGLDDLALEHPKLPGVTPTLGTSDRNPIEPEGASLLAFSDLGDEAFGLDSLAAVIQPEPHPSSEYRSPPFMEECISWSTTRPLGFRGRADRPFRADGLTKKKAKRGLFKDC